MFLHTKKESLLKIWFVTLHLKLYYSYRKIKIIMIRKLWLHNCKTNSFELHIFKWAIMFHLWSQYWDLVGLHSSSKTLLMTPTTKDVDPFPNVTALCLCWNVATIKLTFLSILLWLYVWQDQQIILMYKVTVTLLGYS